MNFPKYNNISRLSLLECNGCGACYAVCPQDSIVISRNVNGFYEAQVDQNKCIHCGQCVDICHRFEIQNLGIEIKKGTLYAAQSSDPATLLSCASGGIAYELSKYAIENGWRVAGVVYDYTKQVAKTIIVEDIEQIESFKGSKYLQSHTAEAFRSLIENAKNDVDKKYLVFGTPCQIHGLSKIIEKYRLCDQFLLVDLFCHGVPSYLVWDSYLKTLKNKRRGEISELEFRSKTYGWNNMHMKMMIGKAIYRSSTETDWFFKTFFDDLLLNDACFDCKFRMSLSSADIRLGDFWGSRFEKNQDGVSAVAVFTKKGDVILKSVERIRLLGEFDINECLSAQSVKAYQNKNLGEKYFKLLREGKSLPYVVRQYRNRFPAKQKIKNAVKAASAIIPIRLRRQLKLLFKRLVSRA